MRRDAIRQGVAADVERCAGLALLAAPERDRDEWRDVLRSDADAPERLLVVAESGGTAVGYGRARLFEPAPDAPPDTAPRGYHLTGVFVARDRRGSGIGTALARPRRGTSLLGARSPGD